jgi:hypothetical protein
MNFSDRIVMKIRMLLGGALAVVCLLYFVSPGATEAKETSTVIDVQIQEGLLTLKAANAPLANVLIKIGENAGLKTVLKGNLRSTVNLSFENMPLTGGIRRLVGNRSLALIQYFADGPDARRTNHGLVAIWVIETDGQDISPAAHSYDSMKAKSDFKTLMPEDQLLERHHNPSRTFNSEGIQLPHQIDQSTEIGVWRHLLERHQARYAREQAIAGLTWIGSDEAVNAMASALGDTDADIRRQAVEGLGQVGSELATQILGQALMGDPDPEIRLEAIRVLNDLRTEVSQAFIAAAMTDTDKDVKASAQRAIEGW